MAVLLSRPEVFGEVDSALPGMEGVWEMILPDWLTSTAVVRAWETAVHGCLFSEFHLLCPEDVTYQVSFLLFANDGASLQAFFSPAVAEYAERRSTFLVILRFMWSAWLRIR